jgi:RNA polymerase sigma-70 factor (ECF subfamily)
LIINWQAILDEHGKAVWNTAYRLLGNDADASDCFQQTFADALTFTKKQNIKNFRALLLKLATRRSLDVLRQRCRKTNPVSLELIPEMDLKAEDCPIAKAENKELGEVLLNAFSLLDPDEAQIFCLRHIENLSMNEIGQTFGLKENHVGVIVHRAKNRLKLLLEKHYRG